MNIIETKNLTKAYGDFKAVENLNMHIEKGSVYGLLGPNGAGKSTVMKMFLGLTKQTDGTFSIDGKMFFSRISRNYSAVISAASFTRSIALPTAISLISSFSGRMALTLSASI